jgi:hypothetical protein
MKGQVGRAVAQTTATLSELEFKIEQDPNIKHIDRVGAFDTEAAKVTAAASDSIGSSFYRDQYDLNSSPHMERSRLRVQEGANTARLQEIGAGILKEMALHGKNASESAGDQRAEHTQLAYDVLDRGVKDGAISPIFAQRQRESFDAGLKATTLINESQAVTELVINSIPYSDQSYSERVAMVKDLVSGELQERALKLLKENEAVEKYQDDQMREARRAPFLLRAAIHDPEKTLKQSEWDAALIEAAADGKPFNEKTIKAIQGTIDSTERARRAKGTEARARAGELRAIDSAQRTRLDAKARADEAIQFQYEDRLIDEAISFQRMFPEEFARRDVWAFYQGRVRPGRISKEIMSLGRQGESALTRAEKNQYAELEEALEKQVLGHHGLLGKDAIDNKGDVELWAKVAREKALQRQQWETMKKSAGGLVTSDALEQIRTMHHGDIVTTSGLSITVPDLTQSAPGVPPGLYAGFHSAATDLVSIFGSDSQKRNMARLPKPYVTYTFFDKEPFDAVTSRSIRDAAVAMDRKSVVHVKGRGVMPGVIYEGVDPYSAEGDAMLKSWMEKAGSIEALDAEGVMPIGYKH